MTQIDNSDRSEYVSFDPVAQDYDASRSAPPEIQKRMAEVVLAAAALKPGQILLDAGVGTGRFALPLAELGAPVVGIDISANMLAQLSRKASDSEHGRERLLLRVGRGDLRHMPVRTGAVGAVLIVHILHLIADWKAVLADVRRVLAPGGVLLIAGSGGMHTPVREHYDRLVEARGLSRKSIGAHRDEIEAFLKTQGAHLEPAAVDAVCWTRERPVSHTLEMLRRRTWSALWDISDEDNAVFLAETEAWVLQAYGTLDAVEISEGRFSLSSVRWPDNG